jgi:regulator of replication initiation timing
VRKDYDYADPFQTQEEDRAQIDRLRAALAEARAECERLRDNFDAMIEERNRAEAAESKLAAAEALLREWSNFDFDCPEEYDPETDEEGEDGDALDRLYERTGVHLAGAAAPARSEAEQRVLDTKRGAGALNEILAENGVDLFQRNGIAEALAAQGLAVVKAAAAEAERERLRISLDAALTDVRERAGDYNAAESKLAAAVALLTEVSNTSVEYGPNQSLRGSIRAFLASAQAAEQARSEAERRYREAVEDEQEGRS